jgi:hypothetical protein
MATRICCLSIHAGLDSVSSPKIAITLNLDLGTSFLTCLHFEMLKTGRSLSLLLELIGTELITKGKKTLPLLVLSLNRVAECQSEFVD